jgi:hypothetical protein
LKIKKLFKKGGGKTKVLFLMKIGKKMHVFHKHEKKDLVNTEKYIEKIRPPQKFP